MMPADHPPLPTDAGQTWVKQTSPTTADLQSIVALGEASAVAVGGGGTVLRTGDRGATWTKSNPGGRPVLLGVTAVQA